MENFSWENNEEMTGNKKKEKLMTKKINVVFYLLLSLTFNMEP